MIMKDDYKKPQTIDGWDGNAAKRIVAILEKVW